MGVVEASATDVVGEHGLVSCPMRWCEVTCRRPCAVENGGGLGGSSHHTLRSGWIDWEVRGGGTVVGVGEVADRRVGGAGLATRLIGKELGGALNAVARSIRAMRRPPVPEPVTRTQRTDALSAVGTHDAPAARSHGDERPGPVAGTLNIRGRARGEDRCAPRAVASLDHLGSSEEMAAHRGSVCRPVCRSISVDPRSPWPRGSNEFSDCSSSAIWRLSLPMIPTAATGAGGTTPICARAVLTNQTAHELTREINVPAGGSVPASHERLSDPVRRG